MVYIPVIFTCCYSCSVNYIKSCVDSLLESPPEDSWPLCRDRMFVPVLRRLAELDPKRRMPLSWLDPETPLVICPNVSSIVDYSIKVRYWQLCWMVRMGWRQEFFRTFEALADSILSILAKDDARDEGLWLQIKLIRNEDRVLRIVKCVAESKWVREWKGYVRHFSQCGSLKYALLLAKNIKSKRPCVMKAFVSQIEDEIDRENHLRLTVWTAVKDRNSSLHALGADVLRMILDQTRPPEIVLWEDVLGGFIQHDIRAAV